MALNDGRREGKFGTFERIFRVEQLFFCSNFTRDRKTAKTKKEMRKHQKSPATMSDAVNSMVTYCVNDTVRGEKTSSVSKLRLTKCLSLSFDDNLNNKQSAMPLFGPFWSAHLNNYLFLVRTKEGNISKAALFTLAALEDLFNLSELLRTTS
jgi:hypothetical protein